MAYGLSNGHVTDDVTWPWKVKLVTPIRLQRNISKTTWATDFKFGRRLCNLYWEYWAGAQIIFPESGRGLGHVTATIFGSTVGYPSDSLASCFNDTCSKCVDTVSLTVRADMGSKRTPGRHLSMNSVSYW